MAFGNSGNFGSSGSGGGTPYVLPNPLVDGSIVPSIDVNTRYLTDSTSLNSIDWGNRNLLSGAEQPSLSWGGSGFASILGFYGTSPVIQQSVIRTADGSDIGIAINSIIDALVACGLVNISA